MTQPTATSKNLFNNSQIGPWLALLSMALLFALPVYLAYRFAQWFQPIADQAMILPLVEAIMPIENRSPLLAPH